MVIVVLLRNATTIGVLLGVSCILKVYRARRRSGSLGRVSGQACFCLAGPGVCVCRALDHLLLVHRILFGVLAV